MISEELKDLFLGHDFRISTLTFDTSMTQALQAASNPWHHDEFVESLERTEVQKGAARMIMDASFGHYEINTSSSTNVYTNPIKHYCKHNVF